MGLESGGEGKRGNRHAFGVGVSVAGVEYRQDGVGAGWEIQSGTHGTEKHGMTECEGRGGTRERGREGKRERGREEERGGRFWAIASFRERDGLGRPGKAELGE